MDVINIVDLELDYDKLSSMYTMLRMSGDNNLEDYYEQIENIIENKILFDVVLYNFEDDYDFLMLLAESMKNLDKKRNRYMKLIREDDDASFDCYMVLIYFYLDDNDKPNISITQEEKRFISYKFNEDKEMVEVD